VALTYNQRVKSPLDVIQHLQFSTGCLPTAINTALCSLLQIHIKDWLLGTGHPAGLRGDHVNESDFVSAASEPLFRSKLFLTAFSDCELIPVDETDKFEVRSLPAFCIPYSLSPPCFFIDPD